MGKYLVRYKGAKIKGTTEDDEPVVIDDEDEPVKKKKSKKPFEPEKDVVANFMGIRNAKKETGEKGSAKSGNHGHRGRAGKVGGSAPSGSGVASGGSKFRDEDVESLQEQIDELNIRAEEADTSAERQAAKRKIASLHKRIAASNDAESGGLKPGNDEGRGLAGAYNADQAGDRWAASTAPPGSRPNPDGSRSVYYSHRYEDSNTQRSSSLAKTNEAKRAVAATKYEAGATVQVPKYEKGKIVGYEAGTITGQSHVQMGSPTYGHRVEARSVKLADGTTRDYTIASLKKANAAPKPAKLAPKSNASMWPAEQRDEAMQRANAKAPKRKYNKNPYGPGNKG